MRLEHAPSIDALPTAQWDACLGDRGAFAASGLRLLERLFGAHQPRENAWAFHYYWIERAGRRPALATFFTEALWKDDMLSPAEQSAAVEERRRADPYLGTSKILAMGSLLTEGDHLFLDREAGWRSALDLLLADVRERAAGSGAAAVVLRDVPLGDDELLSYLTDQGFSALPLPPAWVLHMRPGWSSAAEFLVPLKRQWRKELRNKVFRWNDRYTVEILRAGGRAVSEAELARFYELYLEVKSRSLELNTFALPAETFREVLEHRGWEILSLRLRLPTEESIPVSVVVSFVGRDHYVPIVMGVDYRYVRTHAAYRQTLWRVIRRARELGSGRIHFGLAAPIEKARFGCLPRPGLMLHMPVSS